MTPAPGARGAYADQGFYRSRSSVLPPDLVASAREGIDAVREGRYDTGRPPHASPWQPGDDPAALCKVELAHAANRALGRVARNPGLGEWVAEVVGAERVQVWWVQMLYKPPSAAGSPPTHVGWHQDYQYWQHDWASPEGLLTAWVALSDVTPQSGPLRFIRGSHRWGFRGDGDFFADDPEAQRAALAAPEGETWDEAAAVLPPGGVSLHDGLTYHGSSSNQASAPRCSLVLHLCTDRARLREGTPGALTRFLDDPAVCPVLTASGAR